MSRLPQQHSDPPNGFGGLARPVRIAALALVAAVVAFALGLFLAGMTSALLPAVLVMAGGGALALWDHFRQGNGGAVAPPAVQRDIRLVLRLTAMSRRCVLVTDMDGVRVASNSRFDTLCGGNRAGLADALGPEQASALIAAIRGRDAVDRTLERTPVGPVTLTVERTSRHLIWQISTRDPAPRLEREMGDLMYGVGPALEALSIGAAVLDPAGRPVYLNTVLRRWLGLHGDGAAPQGLTLSGENGSLACADGSVMPVTVATTPLPVRRKGEMFGSLALVRDARGARSLPSMAALDESALTLLLDQAPIAMALLDGEGAVIRANARFERLSEGDGGEGRLAAEAVIVPEDRGLMRDRLEAAINGAAPDAPVDVHLAVDGAPARLHVAGLQHSGDVAAALYLADASQEKSFEQQFVQAQKMQAVGQLAGGVAHDFNNLLTAILGFCDLLLSRHGAGDPSFSDIIQIRQNANRAANLVRQLLALSRQQTLRPRVIYVTDVLAELSALLRRLIGEPIELDVQHGRELPPIRVDQGQFEQVIVNLAVNARDAMPDGGRLSIRTVAVAPGDAVFAAHPEVPPGHYLKLTIRDSGVGIPEDIQAKVFEPFFTTKQLGQGTGLGLATVYGIVKQTGGFVFLDSSPDAGTTFTLLFRAHEGDTDDAPDGEGHDDAQERQRDLTGKGTILLVEDETAVRLFAARALANKGYQVMEADSAETALELYQDAEGAVDLIISDVVMPGMDGPALMEAIGAQGPRPPVIFISGYAEDMLRKSLEGDDVRFLGKPFSLKSLAEEVKKTLSP
ncbi:hybrid sensor histidine kinase/response regulator [Yunchengibacter salinarum]|uniref:hybrid sensor histidine kinase/response regulator n=1 Tax=Yunchengibacter salinarum TaxID=3133399 RepID=UPI0035B69A57